MNRYWDLSEKEKSLLTEEDVKAMVRVELMEKGVVNVEPPQIEEVVETILPTQTAFQLEIKKGEYGSADTIPIVWNKEEDAATVLAAIVASNGQRMKSDYLGGEYRKYATQGIEVSMVVAEILNYQDIVNAKAEIEENAAKKRRNTDVKNEYDGALKEIREATEDLWADYWECVEKKRVMENHKKTFEEYVNLAGDEDMATKFLLKAIGGEAANGLNEWFGMSLFASVENSDEA